MCSGIQTRLAALYGAAGPSKLAVVSIVPGAYVRRLKMPDLLEGEKASRNPQIQREIDGLRSMSCVASSSQSLVESRLLGKRGIVNFLEKQDRPVRPLH